MPAVETEEIQKQLEALRSDIRQIAHDISTPLGVVRLVAHYLEGRPDDESQREHYCQVISQNVAKIEANLDRLRAASDAAASRLTPPRPADDPH